MRRPTSHLPPVRDWIGHSCRRRAYIRESILSYTPLHRLVITVISPVLRRCCTWVCHFHPSIGEMGMKVECDQHRHFLHAAHEICVHQLSLTLGFVRLVLHCVLSWSVITKGQKAYSQLALRLHVASRKWNSKIVPLDSASRVPWMT